MMIINKSMDLDDLKTKEAQDVIYELSMLIREFENKGCKISSWYGDCDEDPIMTELNLLNRGYEYKPILNSKDDLKYPSFLLWEIYWVYSNLNLKKGDKVLDIGGACSLFSFYLASKGISVVALDLNGRIVEEANKTASIMGIDYKAVCSDAEKYVLETTEKFDCITSICVFEHIEKDKRKRIVRELHNVLKEDGNLAFTFDYKNPSNFVKIDSVEDIEDQFLCNDNLYLVGNQEFYDNNKNYLISFFYRKPAMWKRKIGMILNGEFPFYKFFSTSKENDYTFGSVFLKRK